VFVPGRSVVWPVHRSKNLTMYPYGTLFCTEVKYIATSILHDERLQEVAVSGEAPGILHGDAAVQIWTDFTGSALDGPNVVGTASGLLPDGDELGEACGEAEA
jgi:hypothetical protein